MTSTPVSLDESLNGSWIDINSASQIHSPMDDDSPELLRPPYSLAESVQNLGLISFQVERFLQEAQRNQNNSSSNSQLNLHQSSNATTTGFGGLGLNVGATQQPPCPDDNSGIYMSDSEISVDGLDGKTLIDSLRRHNQQQQHYQQKKQIQMASSRERNNRIDPHSMDNVDLTNPRLSKSGDCLADQLSDSLSLLSRTSAFGNRSNYEQQVNFQDFDWLWDWAPQPEYFTGQEWKVYAPKQDYLMRQRQLYCGDLDKNHAGSLFSSEVMSLLFLTNILSIIIGAGLTYSILIRRSNL